MAAQGLRIDGIRIRDSKDREVTFRGINVAGDSKFPRYPDQPSHEPKGFFETDNISFVGRPFTEDEARVHFARLKRWGYNVIRYIVTWEALEPAGWLPCNNKAKSFEPEIAKSSVWSTSKPRASASS